MRRIPKWVKVRWGVVKLPAGPEGDPGPFMTVDGWMFSSQLSEEDSSLASDFVTFVTNADNQTAMIRAAERVPANTNVESLQFPTTVAFLDSAQNTYLAPALGEEQPALEVGRDAYRTELESVTVPADETESGAESAAEEDTEQPEDAAPNNDSVQE
ncbi:MAG: extracellular solute-binding protein [Caldilineaceae bacterium]|nr:extracellular solute-binding protein [Caldilineaceae bacterium]